MGITVGRVSGTSRAGVWGSRADPDHWRAHWEQWGQGAGLVQRRCASGAGGYPSHPQWLVSFATILYLGQREKMGGERNGCTEGLSDGARGRCHRTATEVQCDVAECRGIGCGWDTMTLKCVWVAALTDGGLSRGLGGTCGALVEAEETHTPETTHKHQGSIVSMPKKNDVSKTKKSRQKQGGWGKGC